MTDQAEQPERLDLRSHVIVGDKVEELLRLFPEVRTEDGQIDFDLLRLALGESLDVGNASLVARAVALGLTDDCPPEARESCRSEGWIRVPAAATSLHDLIGA